MWNSQAILDKYQYVKTSPYFIRGIGVLGILTTLLMGYGMWKYISLESLYVIVFGPIVIIFIGNKLLRFFIQLFYPKFDIKEHESFVAKFWKENPEPSVDVFLPWAGEDLNIHEEVLKAVRNLNYKNFQVYMLDDVGREDHKKMAEKYEFNYLSRPNKGEYKKSGNLQYGYEHSQGEFVLILDADFIPTKDSLHDLIPYIVNDPEMGILQTPQFFEQTKDVHSRSKIEFGGGNIVEDFYRVVMPCRDEFKAGMCVGTSAVYRRAAIEKLNGTPKVHASEDLATGLLITQYGYYVKYLPLIVSIGKSPESYQGYFKQHMRWCSGNLVFARYWPNARMNLMARIIYMTNPMYYLSEALTIIFSFQFLILLYFHSDSLSLYNTLYFLPYILLSRIVIPLSKTTRNKLGTKLAALSNSYTYFYTYIRMLTKGVPAWQPTGVKVSKLHEDFLSAFNIGTFVSGLFILGFTYVLFSKPEIFGNYNTYIVLGWTFYSVFWHALFLTFVLKYIHPFKSADIQNILSRTLLHAKTYSISVLGLVLIGLAVYNFTISGLNPQTPTRVALAAIMEDQQPVDAAAALVESGLAKKKVLYPTDRQIQHQVVKPVEPSYSFIVEPGDAKIKIATKAVVKYQEFHNLVLSERQVNSAASLIVKNEVNKNPIRPGQEISFDKELIEQSINSVLKNNQG